MTQHRQAAPAAEPAQDAARRDAAQQLARQLAHEAATSDGMLDALDSERRLIEELTVIMRRQREAVAGDDLQAVDDSVYAVQRVLFTLGEARKRRRSLNHRVGGNEELALRDLERAFGPRFGPDLRDARERLQLAARTLSDEVAINRRVLREALAAGDDYVRALFGGESGKGLYGADAGQVAERGSAAGGMLVDRQA